MEDCKGGFPHSEIAGSKGASASPALIAACHVLHRLSTPRHPSEALQRLIVSQQNSCIDCPGDGKRYPPDLCLILLARRCLLEPVLKAYEGPDKFFLHNVNAANLAIGCKPVRSRCAYHLCSSSRYGASTKRNGGARRSRTDDILLAKQALYQLSYGPITGNKPGEPSTMPRTS